MMKKQNSSTTRVGERRLLAPVSGSDDETTSQFTTTSNNSHSNDPFPFIKGRSSLSLVPPPVGTTTTMTMTTGIGARLDAAVAAAKPVNRSADLVPLTQDYYKMKKQLKSLTNAARVYHSYMLKMNKAHREIVQQFSLICANSPIHAKITGGDGGDSPSFVSINQAATDQFQIDAALYNQMIVQYLEEWKFIVTNRVDVGLEQTRKLQETLFHYQSKVNKLRYRVMLNEDQGGSIGSNKSSSSSSSSSSAVVPVPTKLLEKLERNIQKLDQAWKTHECTASKLCCLIEEVTMRGWKDLYPVVQAAMAWQVQRASTEGNAVLSLVTLQQHFASLYNEKIQLSSDEEPMQVVVAVTAAASQAASSSFAAAAGVSREKDSDDNDREGEEGLEVDHIGSRDYEEMDDDVVVVSDKEGKQEGYLDVVHGSSEEMNDDDDDGIVVVSNGKRRIRDFFKILRKQTATPVYIGEAYSTDDDDIEDGDKPDDEKVQPAMTTSIFQNKEDNVEDGAVVCDNDASFVRSKWEPVFPTDDDVFADGKEASKEPCRQPIEESSPFDEGLVRDQDDQYSRTVAAIVQRRWEVQFLRATSGTPEDQQHEATYPTDSAVSDHAEIAMDDATRATPKKQNLASPSDKEKIWDDPSLNSSSTLDEKIQVEGTGPIKDEPTVDALKSLKHNHLLAIETSTTIDTDDEEQGYMEKGKYLVTPSGVISI